MCSDMELKNRSALLFYEAIDEHIVNICTPLSHLDVDYFGYFRFYKDGTYLKLFNNLEWVKFYITNYLADKSSAFAEPIINIPLFKQNLQIWPESSGNDCLSALYEHNIWNGINFATKYENYIEIYCFATKIEKTQIANLYLNQFDILKRFKIFFYDQIAKRFDFENKEALAVQKNKTSFFWEANSKIISNLSFQKDKDIKTFLNETKISRHWLGGNDTHIFLTSRESECLKYLSTGKTMKEIAKIMNLSPRTVESYITNLKIKMGVTSKSDLIARIFHYDNSQNLI